MSNFSEYFYIGYVSKVNVLCTTALDFSFDVYDQTLTARVSLR